MKWQVCHFKITRLEKGPNKSYDRFFKKVQHLTTSCVVKRNHASTTYQPLICCIVKMSSGTMRLPCDEGSTNLEQRRSVSRNLQGGTSQKSCPQSSLEEPEISLFHITRTYCCELPTYHLSMTVVTFSRFLAHIPSFRLRRFRDHGAKSRLVTADGFLFEAPWPISLALKNTRSVHFNTTGRVTNADEFSGEMYVR